MSEPTRGSRLANTVADRMAILDRTKLEQLLAGGGTDPEVERLTIEAVIKKVSEDAEKKVADWVKKLFQEEGERIAEEMYGDEDDTEHRPRFDW